MRYRYTLIVAFCMCLTAMGLGLAGCEQAAEEPIIPAGPGDNTYGTGDGSTVQGRNSSLGKAKDTAQNIINQAEQQSQDIANQADGMSNPDR